jgi:poly-gamma-glutamate capsule biosynthesis protein CapA/YwtB (metallophosphatase superfamily)
LEDFKRALARVQSDYGFYIDCQASPAVALAGYDLSADERSALTDPKKLADVLRGGIGISPLRITVTISGKHDWVNRTRPKKTTMAEVDLDAKVATEVEAIKKAGTDEARTGAAVRLMELIG